MKLAELLNGLANGTIAPHCADIADALWCQHIATEAIEAETLSSLIRHLKDLRGTIGKEWKPVLTRFIDQAKGLTLCLDYAERVI